MRMSPGTENNELDIALLNFIMWSRNFGWNNVHSAVTF